MLLLILMFFANNSYSIFFFETETREGIDLAKGAVLTSTLLEEIATVEDNNGISLNEFESTLSRHDEDARNFLGSARNIENEANNLGSAQYIQNSKRKAAQNIKNMSRLIETLCALGPESCVVANSYNMANQQKETNEILTELLIQNKSEKLNEERTKLLNAKKSKESIQAINDIPSKIFKNLAERFR
jgi:hypothetical protein